MTGTTMTEPMTEPMTVAMSEGSTWPESPSRRRGVRCHLARASAIAFALAEGKLLWNHILAKSDSKSPIESYPCAKRGSGEEYLPSNPCRFNRSMQHH